MARVKLNRAGFRALRTDPKTLKLVAEIAKDIADASGTDAPTPDAPRNRARAAVVGSARQSDAMMRALGAQMGRRR